VRKFSVTFDVVFIPYNFFYFHSFSPRVVSCRVDFSFRFVYGIFAFVIGIFNQRECNEFIMSATHSEDQHLSHRLVYVVTILSGQEKYVPIKIREKRKTYELAQNNILNADLGFRNGVKQTNA